MEPKTPTYIKLTEEKSSTSPKSPKKRLLRILSGSKTFSTPASPNSSPVGGKFFQSNSLDSVVHPNTPRPVSFDEKALCENKNKEKGQDCLSKGLTMTSPAINGQKENGKTESCSGVSAPTTAGTAAEESNVRPAVPEMSSTSTAPFTAWWRVFKLANLLMQQGC